MSDESFKSDEEFTLESKGIVVVNPPCTEHKVLFEHSRLNRQVEITGGSDPFSLSDAIVGAIFDLAALNYQSVTTILESHGFRWGKKHDS